MELNKTYYKNLRASVFSVVKKIVTVYGLYPVNSYHIPTLILAFSLTLYGCEKPTPTVTEVPKPATTQTVKPNATQSSSSNNMPAMAGIAEQANSVKTPTWTAPAGWIEQTGNAMRKGSWKIQGANTSTADVSVTTFPGNVGGDLANINRWLGQIKGTPVDATEVERMKTAGAITIDSKPAYKVLLKGENQATLGAILFLGTHTWFFKMTGETSLVTEQQANFDTFLQSVKFPK